jgi:hypothetical protein
MDNPGAFTLGDFQIGAAGQYGGQNPSQGQPGCAPIACDLAGMAACSIQLRFSGGAGTTCTVYVQTSLDQGQSWFDVAAVAFTTVAAVAVLNLSGNDHAAPAAPASLSLTPGTILDGPLGDRLQMVAITTGIYPSGTLLSGRGVAR